VKSKAELAAAAEARRDEALSTSLDTSSKGSQMLAKLGYKPGERLGAAGNPYALAEPVGLEVKDDRGGIGMDSEKKRKVREAVEQAEHQAKRAKAEEGDFRERVAKEREEKRMEGQWWGAMRVAEKLDTETAEGGSGDKIQSAITAEAPKKAPEHTSSPPREIPDEELKPQQASGLPNLLWRPIPRERAEKEHERRMRHDLEQSLSRNPAYTDPEEDEQDRQALGKEEVEVDLALDDPELEAYLAEPIAERLGKVVKYLREKFWYCFWCKSRYSDQEMDGCPGLTEEDHD
jgi:Domain of unknown function (DUF4187)/G-patch domain